jgi:protein FrlC
MPAVNKEQIAAANLNYRMYPLEFFLDTQKELGLRSIEFCAVAPHFLMNYEGYRDTAPIRAMAEEKGLQIVAFTPESALYQFPVAAYNDEVRELAVPYYKNALRAAAELGAKIMPLDIAGGLKTEKKEDILARAVDTLKKIAPAAEEAGVTIAVETMPAGDSAAVNTLPELLHLLEAVNHPSVKAAVDISAIRQARETLEEWFEALGDRIVYIHFTDGKPEGRLVWGEGLHPLDNYLETLEQYGYTGYLGQNSNVRGMWFDKSLLAEDGSFAGREFYPDNYWFYPPAADKKNLEAFAPFIKD